MNTIGNRIHSRRVELGLSQTELANRLGYTGKAAISKIETGKGEVPSKKLFDFAEALDTTVSYLIGEQSHSDTLTEIASKAVYNKELYPIVNDLSDEAKERLMLYAKFLRELEQKDKSKAQSNE